MPALAVLPHTHKHIKLLFDFTTKPKKYQFAFACKAFWHEEKSMNRTLWNNGTSSMISWTGFRTISHKNRHSCTPIERWIFLNLNIFESMSSQKCITISHIANSVGSWHTLFICLFSFAIYGAPFHHHLTLYPGAHWTATFGVILVHESGKQMRFFCCFAFPSAQWTDPYPYWFWLFVALLLLSLLLFVFCFCCENAPSSIWLIDHYLLWHQM